LRLFKLAHICIKVANIHKVDKQVNPSASCFFYRKSVSRNATHRQSYNLIQKEDYLLRIQGRNVGGQGGHDSPGTESLWARRVISGGAEKSQQCHK